jgi:predicted transcriptional regulator
VRSTKIPTNFRFPEDVREKLDRLARFHDRSWANMVEHLIREAFRQDEAAIKRAEARAAREKE